MKVIEKLKNDIKRLEYYKKISINQDIILEIDIAGKGGKEKSLLDIFYATRDNHKMYDGLLPDGRKIEIKKQQSKQWFDAGKYHNLSKEQKNIYVIFIIYRDDKITKIFYLKLGKFINILTKDKNAKDWCLDMLEDAYNFKKKYPSVQLKIDVNIIKFLENNQKDCTILYDRYNKKIPAYSERAFFRDGIRRTIEGLSDAERDLEVQKLDKMSKRHFIAKGI